MIDDITGSCELSKNCSGLLDSMYDVSMEEKFELLEVAIPGIVWFKIKGEKASLSKLIDRPCTK
ncbi:MAG: hypothetical protein KHW52_03815 [Clostridium sp.]|nr:hypothetical protein [Clostridium sp.]